jgi:hypothetical protein
MRGCNSIQIRLRAFDMVEASVTWDWFVIEDGIVRFVGGRDNGSVLFAHSLNALCWLPAVATSLRWSINYGDIAITTTTKRFLK